MIKNWLFTIFLFSSGMAAAQPFPFNGYTIYDYLVTANHPNGCPSTWVTGLPEDSTWVNMLDNTVMTGYFGYSWMDLPGDDLLLESSFHFDNYSVRLILEGGDFSSSVVVDETMWTALPFVNWKHIYTGCIPGQAASPRNLVALDFVEFGIFPDDVVIGIEITFLPTVGLADFAGAYIIVPPCGLLDLGPDKMICPGETVTIDATMPNASYLWQDGSIAPVYHDAGPGKYWVKVTIYDCSKVDTLNVNQPIGPPDLGNDTLLCTGESLLLDATTEDAAYEWQNNSTQATLTVTQSDHYSVTVTIDECVYTDDIDVDFAYPPVIDLGPDIILCEGLTWLLDASTSNATYEWQDQSTDSQFDVTEPGTYSVIVNVAGCTAEDEIDVTYIYPEHVDLGTDITLCTGESLFLDAFIPGATYEWQDHSTESSFNVNSPGLYSVTVTIDDCTNSDEIEVNYVSSIDFDLGIDTVLCHGESLLLDATIPNASHSWQDHSTGSTYTVTGTGTYFVEILLDACSARDTILVSYIDIPLVDLGRDTSLCVGETLKLIANTSGGNYQWQDQSTADSLLVATHGKYWVVVDVSGCMTSDTIDIVYTTLPDVNLGNDTTLCNEETIILDVQIAGLSYVWQDNSTAQTLFITQPGTYSVTVSQQTCTSADTIQVNYNILTPIDLGHDTTLCAGASLLLDAETPNAILEWQDHSTTTTWNVTQPGSYWVNAHEGQCSIADTIEVEYLSGLSLNLGPDTTLCNDQTFILDATLVGATYQWQDQSSTSAINVKQTGRYWVEVSIGDCMISDTIVIDYSILPAPDLGNDTTLCEGQTLLLDADNVGVNYKWQDLSSDPYFLVAEAGAYSVTVSLGACEASDTIQVDYHTLVSIDLGNDTTLCEGQTLSLNVFSFGSTYEWQDQSSLPDYQVTIPGTFFVEVNDGFCKNSDTIRVSYLSISSFSLGADTTICDGQVLTLQSNAPGAQYIWQDNSTNSTFTVTQPGLYWVQVHVGECFAADSIEVDMSNPVFVELGLDTKLCPDQTLLLEVEIPGVTYLWNDLSNLPSYLISQPGTYWVVVDAMGCKANDTIEVDYVALPPLFLGNDTVLCPGENLLLNATIQDATYTWQDHSTASTYLVNHTGNYTVNVNLHSCSVADTIQVEFLTNIVLDLGNDQNICDGETIILDPGLQGDLEYLWQDQTTTLTYAVQNAGQYWLQVKDDCGISSDTVSVTVDQCDCKIYFPNTFSPNGDNINDMATPRSMCELTAYSLQIFDRYGGLLFETRNAGDGWDGTMNSNPVQSGVYVYLLIYAFEDGQRQRLTGDITVLR